jgi:hypothetical protein
MRLMLRTSFLLLVLSLLLSTAAAADVPPSGQCLRLTVAAHDLASSSDQGRQHYRIVFENQCDSARIVYWCAEHPSKNLASAPVCMRTGNAQGGIAAPLYAVVRQREFQWTFPTGTKIRFVDCNDSSFPTSDFRCSAPGKRQ